jgi:lipopolysaccharide/colanic/teichoic acid biosynthesis glycosyltransferase
MSWARTEFRSFRNAFSEPFSKASDKTRETYNGAFPYWKRAFDLIVGALALLFLAPLLLIVGMLVCLDGGPVIFSHTRIGTDGRLFRVLKFRTMTLHADAALSELLARDARARAEWARDRKLRNDPRITAIGRLLRKTSIDELPQILNVLRGEMSIVGPRPIVQAEAERYGRYIKYYKQCRPGITGLWQVSGRNDISYRKRVALDTVYSKTRTKLKLDVKILLLTIPVLLFSKGSY